MKRLLVFAVILSLAATAAADWDPGSPSKWVQFPDLAPTGMDVNTSFPYYILADDFLCTETGPITDIHIWGSWYHDYLPFDYDPYGVSFVLSIHEDIPDSVSSTGYSMPGDVLWYRFFDGPAGMFQARIWEEGINEGWFEPPFSYEFPGDHVCWQYNFFIDDAEAFVQHGSPDNPIIYWLDVQAISADQEAWFGWKTSLDHWNDDAVWGTGEEPYFGPWFELIYPDGHPMYSESIDLAFVITTSDTGVVDYDWGDAPDFTYPFDYPTYAANGGASHGIVPGFQMGPSIDPEGDGQPDFPATGDDLAGVDDEDGVTFVTTLVEGSPATVRIDMTASMSGGFIDAWIDFGPGGGGGQDGSWAEAGDQIITSAWVPGGAYTDLNFNVPAGSGGGCTFARFRLSSYGGLASTGGATDGEIEDYEVCIEHESWKWDQYPDESPTGIDVNCTEPFILADDFLCEAPGRLTTIRVWGSWLSDWVPFGTDPGAVDFTLSIHEDIPAGVGGINYSRPGNLLWVRDFPAHDPGWPFTYDIWLDGVEEGWLNPPDVYTFPADWTIWMYSFEIPPEEAFHQIGMPDRPIVYWLDVQARPHDVDAFFGWKTSLDHWNDDAVWAMGTEPYPGPWFELYYPDGHPLYPQSIDLAFQLEMHYGTGADESEVPLRYDLGQNVPNPFNPKTSIAYEVPAGGCDVLIEVYDVSGRLVRSLVNGFESEGRREVIWDGRDDTGHEMSSGVYFYKLVTPETEMTRKMLLVK